MLLSESRRFASEQGKRYPSDRTHRGRYQQSDGPTLMLWRTRRKASGERGEIVRLFAAFRINVHLN